jgi:hypothetical protein
MLRSARLLFVTIVLSVSQVTVTQNHDQSRRSVAESNPYLASDELAGRETGSAGHRRGKETEWKLN